MGWVLGRGGCGSWVMGVGKGDVVEVLLVNASFCSCSLEWSFSFLCLCPSL